MAALWMFEGSASGFLTPTPQEVLHQSNDLWKTLEGGQDVQADSGSQASGSQTPVFVDHLNLQALQSKLTHLQDDIEGFGIMAPPGLENNDLDSDKVIMSTKPVSAVLGSLLRREELLESKQEPKKLEISYTCAEQYMYGKACNNCTACFRNLSSGQEANVPSSSGANYIEAMNDGKSPFAVFDSKAPVNEHYAPPILSTNPIWCQSPASPELQGVPHQVPWCASAGSGGHPYTCAPACKYARSAKGCKDGSMCDHCHLCRWVRRGKPSKIM